MITYQADGKITINYKQLLTSKLLNDNNNDNFYKSTKIPLIIFQTYYDKNKIPDIVYSNIKKYAPEYKHYIFNDDEAKKFLSSYFKPLVLDTFNKLILGAHKADLLRYCLIYIYGGVYLDIKIELIKPLSEIITNNNYIYSVLSNAKDHVFQAVIASKPRNIFFLKLINYIIENKNPKDYLDYCKDFYNNIFKDTKKPIKLGVNQSNNQLYYLFEEKCTPDPLKCYDGLDRYGVCCFIYKNNKPIIKCRYASYPW